MRSLDLDGLDSTWTDGTPIRFGPERGGESAARSIHLERGGR